MILVGQYDSPYVRRVAISLHLLGLPFERDTRSVFADAEGMRRINPVGRIPSLVLDDGEVLIDSAAILDHLDERVGPERALLPPRGPERRQALRIVALATGTLDKAGAIVYERTLRPPDKRWSAWVDRARVQLDSGLAALERATGERGEGWHGGDRPTQPDVTLGCLLGYLRHRAPDAFPAGAWPALERHAAACDALPAFAAARPADDERMPDGL
jgi:glutathione S-transferase